MINLEYTPRRSRMIVRMSVTASRLSGAASTTLGLLAAGLAILYAAGSADSRSEPAGRPSAFVYGLVLLYLLLGLYLLIRWLLG